MIILKRKIRGKRKEKDEQRDEASAKKRESMGVAGGRSSPTQGPSLQWPSWGCHPSITLFTITTLFAFAFHSFIYSLPVSSLVFQLCFRLRFLGMNWQMGTKLCLWVWVWLFICLVVLFIYLFSCSTFTGGSR